MQGDIWSTGAFSFESPLKDLLDSGNYTLRELLEQDELLQELRGMHPVLVDFFSSEASVLELVHHVIGRSSYASELPPSEETNTANDDDNGAADGAADDDDGEKPKNDNDNSDATTNLNDNSNMVISDEGLQKLRYPYMACEVLCSEINSIIDTLVDGHVVEAEEGEGEGAEEGEDTILDVFFSLLYNTPSGKMDDYRAGYFDKILSVLCRKRPQALTTYINEGGPKGRLPLMKSMLNHLYSHSILQVVQRLLLPIPQDPHDDPERFQPEDEEDEDILHLFRCRWSESPEGIGFLLDSLFNTADQTDQTIEQQERQLNEAQNASEVLITVIQNSPLTSTTMLTLTEDPTLEKIMNTSSELPDGVEFSPHDSILTCSMNVLESLVLQLGGYGSVATTLDEPGPMATPDTIQKHLPQMLEKLVGLLRNPTTKEWTSNFQFHTQEPQRILGTSRLRMIRLIESLVLLGNPQVDQILCQSKCLEICLDLFWEFEWNSMLHQSVANLLVHVFEGANSRASLQHYFLNQSNLLARLIESFEDDEANSETDKVTKNLNELGIEEEKEDEEGEDRDTSNLSTESNTAEYGEEEDQDAVVNDDGEEVLPVSDDDVDAALESQRLPEEEVGEASPLADMIQQHNRGNFKSQTSSRSLDLSVLRDILHSGSTDAPSRIPSLRKGYMGHVIIICQALVHACTNPGDDQNDFENTADFSTNQLHPDMNEEDVQLIIANLIQNHPMQSRWQDFVATTLASETAIQSTPLGGFNASAATIDPLHTARPGLTDLSDFNDEEYDDDDDEDDDEEDDMPPDRESGLTIGGDVIDMDDNDIEIAASMMDAAYGSGNKGGDTFSPDFSRNDYMFDDPLGGGGDQQFDNDSSDEEESAPENVRRASSGSDGGSGGAPPVMDLFAGNFAFPEAPESPPKENGGGGGVGGWSNFANFDNAFAGGGGDGADIGDAPPSVFAEQQPVEFPEPDPVEQTSSPNESTSTVDDIFGSESHELLLDDTDEQEKKKALEEEQEEPVVEVAEEEEEEIKDTGSEHSSDEEEEDPVATAATAAAATN